MDISEVRKVVGRIKSALFKNSNNYSIGMMKSHFRGTGLQFKEHQVYSHGDDVRLIDWNILARTAEPFIKSFEEERNIQINVYIDTKVTMLSGYEGISKLQAAIEICCLIYLLAKETGDKVSAVIISDEVTRLKDANGEKGISILVSHLEKKNILTKDGKVNILFRSPQIVPKEKIQITLAKDLNKRREIVLLSDFNDFIPLDYINKNLNKAHLHVFQILSPLDEAQEIPFSILCNNSLDNKKNHSVIRFEKEKDSMSFENKKFKRLRVQNRYLEEFVKEML